MLQYKDLQTEGVSFLYGYSIAKLQSGIQYQAYNIIDCLLMLCTSEQKSNTCAVFLDKHHRAASLTFFDLRYSIGDYMLSLLLITLSLSYLSAS